MTRRAAPSAVYMAERGIRVASFSVHAFGALPAQGVGYGERPLQEEGIVYSDYMGSGPGNKPSHGGHGYKAGAMSVTGRIPEEGSTERSLVAAKPMHYRYNTVEKSLQHGPRRSTTAGLTVGSKRQQRQQMSHSRRVSVRDGNSLHALTR
uniref:Uncharacterized protein n=1 Tax=Vespula pensylvanica TaxID=30213 RepID=A0A834JGE5_VESPE|nr:hypothetical protein H0235_018287 [Vespula pensylvanica]